MAIGKCLRCGVVGGMTEDHVVPSWFKKMLFTMKVNTAKIPSQAWDVELVCAKCNHSKGGEINFAYPQVRLVMKAIIVLWIDQMKKYEGWDVLIKQSDINNETKPAPTQDSALPRQ